MIRMIEVIAIKINKDNKMKESIKTGICFGLTSGTITTLGLMVGLAAGTSSKNAVIGGIITIAIADAMSDALGIHISEESKTANSKKHVWEATAATFLTKLVYALTFAVPVIMMDLNDAVKANILWGMLILTSMSYFIAKDQNEKALHIILEHVTIAFVVIAISQQVGTVVSGI